MYQKKYFYSFMKLNTSELHTVEIWQDTTDIITAQEVTGMTDPFVIEQPEIESIFQVVMGSGCTINMLSETDMMFFNSLYHVNPFTFMVKYIVAGDGAMTWTGYLNPEMMSESFSEDSNYPVSLSGNDGWALMDRFRFANIDGTNYTGLKPKIEILQICLNKIGLWSELLISLSTTFIGMTTSILHSSYVDCANFYDEDNKPMSLRGVVESILAPYGAIVRSKATQVRITDIHTMATSPTITYLRYLLSDLSPLSIVPMLKQKTIESVGYMGTGQGIEKSGGVNRQVVSYSPYPVKDIVDSSLIGIEEFTTVPALFSTKNRYYYKTLLINSVWEILTSADFEASYYTDEKDTNIYLRIPRNILNTVEIAQCKINPWLSIAGANPGAIITTGTGIVRRRAKYTNGICFLITGDILAKTRENPYDANNPSINITQISLKCSLKIGNRYYDGSTNSWVITPSTFHVITLSDHSVISDKFVPIGSRGKGHSVVIGNISEEIILNGNFEMKILSGYQHNTNTNVNLVDNSPDISEIWIKNIKVELTTFDGSKIPDEDIEYVGILDKTFQNEGDTVSLTCGTDSQYADRGKIMKLSGGNYSSIKEWTRAAQTYKIEELLLGSVCSNYRIGRISLNNLKLKSGFSLDTIFTIEESNELIYLYNVSLSIGYIGTFDQFDYEVAQYYPLSASRATYEINVYHGNFTGTYDQFNGMYLMARLSGKKFIIKSAIVNPWNDLIECSLTEITADELIIEK